MALNNDAREILFAGIEIGEALHDGIQLSDIGALTSLPAAISGWSLGLDNIRETFESPNGRQEVLDYFNEEFDIPDDEVEEVVEKAVAWLASTYDLIQAFR